MTPNVTLTGHDDSKCELHEENDVEHERRWEPLRRLRSSSGMRTVSASIAKNDDNACERRWEDVAEYAPRRDDGAMRTISVGIAQNDDDDCERRVRASPGDDAEGEPRRDC